MGQLGGLTNQVPIRKVARRENVDHERRLEKNQQSQVSLPIFYGVSSFISNKRTVSMFRSDLSNTVNNCNRVSLNTNSFCVRYIFISEQAIEDTSG